MKIEREKERERERDDGREETERESVIVLSKLGGKKFWNRSVTSLQFRSRSR